MIPRSMKLWVGLAVAGLTTAAAMFLVLILTITSVVSGTGMSPAAAADCLAPGVGLSDGTGSGAPASGAATRAEQVKNAKLIDAATAKAGFSGQASRIAIITAMGESSLMNLDYGDQVNGVKNPDGSPATSYGLFQQQTSQGWGTLEQVMNPEYATTSFLLGPKHDGKGGLAAVPHWEETDWISSVIHSVQRNSVRDHYTRFIGPADDVIREAGIDVTRKGTGSTVAPVQPGSPSNSSPKCNAGGGSTIGLLEGKWVDPLPGSTLTSPYGPRPAPAGTIGGVLANFHYGMDFSKPGANDEVLAITDLKITVATDNGNPSGGTYVKGHTPDGKLTIGFYHMQKGSLKVKVGDTVAAGTPIGIEGATGNVTGEHLHLEFFPGKIDDPWVPTNSTVDPLPVLKQQGVKL